MCEMKKNDKVLNGNFEIKNKITSLSTDEIY